MTDLQADIDKMADYYPGKPLVEPLANVVEAARRVANGETIWWCEVHEMKGIEDLCGWTRVKNVGPDTCRMVRKVLVGITEDE